MRPDWRFVKLCSRWRRSIWLAEINGDHVVMPQRSLLRPAKACRQVGGAEGPANLAVRTGISRGGTPLTVAATNPAPWVHQCPATIRPPELQPRPPGPIPG